MSLNKSLIINVRLFYGQYCSSLSKPLCIQCDEFTGISHIQDISAQIV